MLMTSDINPDMTQSKYVRDQKKVLFIVEKAH